jgi:alpha-methylacyl-CoA racemase
MLEHGGIRNEPILSARGDRERWFEVRMRLADIFLTRTRDEWCSSFEGTDACITPVLTMAEAPGHRLAVDRDAFVEVAGVVQPAPAPRFGRTPGSVKSGALREASGHHRLSSVSTVAH